MAQHNKDGQGWDQLVVKASSGANLRALSPNSGIVMNNSLFNGYYQGYGTDGIRLGTGRLRYALNGNVPHLRAFTPGETAMIDTPGQTGGYNHSIDVPLSELVEGDNAVRFGTLNIESGYPNAVTNLDLVIDVDYGVVFANSFE